MPFHPPVRSSLRPPASASELDWMRAALRNDFSALETIYLVTNGFESVIRGGELHLDLWPIRDFEFADDDLLRIGSDTCGSDVMIDLSVSPPVVKTQCSYGGQESRLLCPLAEFAAWICQEPAEC